MMNDVSLSEFEKVTVETYQSLASEWAVAHASTDFWEKQFAEFKQLLSSGRILEIGCGTGRDAGLIVDAGYSYIGTDIAPALLDEARKAVPGADFREMSLYDLRFEPGALFDGFWAAAVYLHVPRERLPAALANLHAVLKDDAVGFIAVKEGRGEEMLDREKWGRRDRRWFVYYDQAELSSILESNRFEVVRSTREAVSETTTWLCYFVRKVCNKS